jgi:hypothetical protein
MAAAILFFWLLRWVTWSLRTKSLLTPLFLSLPELNKDCLWELWLSAVLIVFSHYYNFSLILLFSYSFFEITHFSSAFSKLKRFSIIRKSFISLKHIRFNWVDVPYYSSPSTGGRYCSWLSRSSLLWHFILNSNIFSS